LLDLCDVELQKAVEPRNKLLSVKESPSQHQLRADSRGRHVVDGPEGITTNLDSPILNCRFVYSG
jgi:hypothetical protein